MREQPAEQHIGQCGIIRRVQFCGFFPEMLPQHPILCGNLPVQSLCCLQFAADILRIRKTRQRLPVQALQITLQL